jgi:hypothetical protein
MTPEGALERVTDGGEPTNPPAPTLAQALEQAFNQPPEPPASPQPAVEALPIAAPAAAPAPAEPDAPTEPAVVEPPALAPPESRLAPIFELAKLPLDEAAPQAAAQMRDLAAYDPAAFGVLLNGMYQAAGNTYRQWALEDLGVSQEQMTKFTDWLSKGGGELQAPMYYPPFPVPNSDPNSPENGLVTLPGIGVVDTKEDFGKRFYENEKYRYESEANAARAEYEKTVQGQRDQERKDADTQAAAQRQIAEREQSFMSGTIQAIDSRIGKALPQLSAENSWLSRAAKSYAFGVIQDAISDPASDVAKLLKEAAPYVQQGAGRTAEYQQRVVDVLAKAALAEVDRFNRLHFAIESINSLTA